MELHQIIEEIADEIGGEVYEGYSGRFMYGKTCLGITCSDVVQCIEVAGSKGLMGAKYDSLGLDYIVYWPNPQLKDDDDE